MARKFFYVCAGPLMLALSLGAAAAMAEAGLRSPQVPVTGSALQQLLDQNDGGITVAKEQVDGGLLKGVSDGIHTGIAIQVELVATDRVASGIYDGHASVPTLFPMFPDSAKAGWFAVVEYLTNPPVRVHIAVFNEIAELKSSGTYLGGDRDGTGFYVMSSSGVFYSQDVRNPGASPQMLYFAGTGLHSGNWWVAAEDRPLGSGSEADYADVVWSVSGGEYSFETAVHRSSWGQVKARYQNTPGATLTPGASDR